MKKILVIPVILLFSASISVAQVSSMGRFSVDHIKGCAPLTITITNANLITTGECTPGKPCLMDYEGQGSQQNLFTYTYTKPGTYKLSVLYQSIGADNITITVVPNIQPDFELYTCSSNRVSLKVTDKNFQQYHINFGDGSPMDTIPFSNNQVANHAYGAAGNYPISIRGKNLNAADNCNPLNQTFTALAVLPTPTVNTLTSLDPGKLSLNFTAAPHLQLHMEIAVNNASTFQLFQSLYGVSADTVTNIKLDDNFYCYRLSAYDPCTSGNNYSNIVCSQKFTALAQSDVNKLNWVTSPAGVNNYAVARNAAPFATTPNQFFDDTNIVCKTNYCYQITTNYLNGSKSISLTKCVDAFTNKLPTAINDASSVVTDNQVALSWIQDPLFKASTYKIYRSQGIAPLTQYGTSVTPNFTDSNYTTETRICYQVVYSDQCDNFSPPGATICPIRLAGTLDKSNVINLSWSGYKGWNNGVMNYTVEKLDRDGNFLASFSTGTDSTLVDDVIDAVNQIVAYRVTATSVDPGLGPSVSNIVRFIKEVNPFYPTAFTPNDDTLNDGFSVSGHFIAKMELNIFDRWGTLIFSTNSNEPWDGTYNGKKMPETTYVWTAKVTDNAARHFNYSGTIVLLNKPK